MRQVRAFLWAVFFALLAAVPGGEAALNKPQTFEAAFPFMPSLSGGEMTVVSGAVEATLGGDPGAFGFFNSTGLVISGLDKVCWRNPCEESPSRQLSILVPPTGSVAFCFPAQAQGRFSAGHVLAMFTDLSQDDDLNSFAVDRSLVAPAIDAIFSFSSVPPIPSGSLTAASVSAPACSASAGLAALDDQTTVVVRDGIQVVGTLVGKDAKVLFSGQPIIPSVQAEFVVLPFADKSSARFERASAADAEDGLELSRVRELVSKLDQSHAQTAVDRNPPSDEGDNTEEFLAGLLNGAVLRLPTGPGESGGFPVDGLHFVRFSSMRIEGEGTGLAWNGRAYLEVDDGRVVGAKNLVGFGFLQMPWWSYVLWAAAITLLIVTMVLKPDKNHPRWDNLRWVGWVATPVAWIIVFLLWDLEVKAVLGASLMQGSSGQFRLIIGLVQIALLGAVSFAAAAPLRIILRNSSLLAHQGTFMGLAGGVAIILGFLFGALYLRAYIGLVLDQVMDRLA